MNILVGGGVDSLLHGLLRAKGLPRAMAAVPQLEFESALALVHVWALDQLWKELGLRALGGVNSGAKARLYHEVRDRDRPGVPPAGRIADLHAALVLFDNSARGDRGTWRRRPYLASTLATPPIMRRNGAFQRTSLGTSVVAAPLNEFRKANKKSCVGSSRHHWPLPLHDNLCRGRRWPPGLFAGSHNGFIGVEINLPIVVGVAVGPY